MISTTANIAYRSGADCLPSSTNKPIELSDVQQAISFLHEDISGAHFEPDEEAFQSYVDLFSCLKELERLKKGEVIDCHM